MENAILDRLKKKCLQVWKSLYLPEINKSLAMGWKKCKVTAVREILVYNTDVTQWYN